MEICSHCHPFFTGRQKLVDTAGRVERFMAKYGDGSGQSASDEVPVDVVKEAEAENAGSVEPQGAAEVEEAIEAEEAIETPELAAEAPVEPPEAVAEAPEPTEESEEAEPASA